METLRRGSRGASVKALQGLLHLCADGVFGALTEEAVMEFQSSRGLCADGVVGRLTWDALMSEGGGVHSCARDIREIIVHCTATAEGRDATVDEIREWHLEKGYSDIGYHYVVYRDGSIHAGRSADVSGAHCKGHNSRSIGVCYVGGMSADGRRAEDTRTEAQKGALLSLLRMLRAAYPEARIYGHRDFAARDCPSFDAKAEYEGL